MPKVWPVFEMTVVPRPLAVDKCVTLFTSVGDPVSHDVGKVGVARCVEWGRGTVQPLTWPDGTI